MAPYVRILVESPFPVLYHVLIRKLPHFYRRCLRLDNNKLYGIIYSEQSYYSMFFGANMWAPLIITLEEKEDEKTFIEVLWHSSEKGLKMLFKVIETLGLKYEKIDEIKSFLPSNTPYNPDLPVPEVDEKAIQLLPEKMKRLGACPFLEVSLEFSDIYICGASRLIYIREGSSIYEKDVKKRCIENRYVECKYYLEALKKQRDLKRNR